MIMKLKEKLKIKLQIFAVACLLTCSSCNSYLDIVPDDGMPSLETAFGLRSTAIRYLYTCYGYMTQEGDAGNDPGLLAGDEMWTIYPRTSNIGINTGLVGMARGLQSVNNVYGDDWVDIYKGIRVCNTLIERAGTVPDLPEWEKRQWIAEAKFLKAWYHFHLIRKWGPVPIIRENLSINSGVDEVRVSRDPVDKCFDYVVELLDEAIPDLPLKVQSRDELGRITRPIAAAVKAKVMVYAASPLFNNNTDQATLVNRDGTRLFKTDKTDAEKKASWDLAAVACREAIAVCREANMALFKYQTRVILSDTILRQLDLRYAITEKWNDEIIWSNIMSSTNSLQNGASPNLQATQYPDMVWLYSLLQPPLKIAEMFYTDRGLPIENDRYWDTINPYDLRVGDNSERWHIRRDYTTVKLNFNREPRFYAWMGFDGGIWYGQKAHTDNPLPADLFWVACRARGAQRRINSEWGPVTGYYAKKYVHPESSQTGTTSYAAISYPWPMFRLADLFLLYAEAINESEGPNGAHGSEMFQYIDSIRLRAGLPKVKEAWDSYSDTPGKYNDPDGMREIIHRERLIELSFEGQRYWDLRRWKEAYPEYAKDIYGFKVTSDNPEDYYRRILLFRQSFGLKDYFWPLSTGTLEQNPNLVQNLGGW
jgi:hypothetical protein